MCRLHYTSAFGNIENIMMQLNIVNDGVLLQGHEKVFLLNRRQTYYYNNNYYLLYISILNFVSFSRQGIANLLCADMVWCFALGAGILCYTVNILYSIAQYI